MRLDELIQGLRITLRDPSKAPLRICDLSEDSRTVVPSSLFVARPGTQTDGHHFIQDAITKGAEAVLTAEGLTERPCGADVAWLTALDLPVALAQMAERFYGSASRRLKLVGVTGTNGKSTVTTFIQQLLDDPTRRCGLLGTVKNIDGRGESRAEMTTPPAPELSYSLSTMVEAGFGAAAIEASSHGIDQDRPSGLDFDVAVFTNLSGDHLDYHASMEAYASVKARLFEALKPEAVAVVSADDAMADRIVRHCQSRVIRCSIDGASGAEVTAGHGPWSLDGTPIWLEGPWGRIEGETRLLGRFNLTNLLLAMTAAHSTGATTDQLRARLPLLRGPEGRLERITGTDDGKRSPVVFVDYAHTDDALAHALGALRPLADQMDGRLHVVVGCGGDRDRTKRPRMGRVASELADVVTVTSDNPRSEDPQAIVRDVLAGVDQLHADAHTEVDRETAIHTAINRAAPADIVLIAGKGHENYQLLPNAPMTAGAAPTVRRIAFDDRLVVRAALTRAGGHLGEENRLNREVVTS